MMNLTDGWITLILFPKANLYNPELRALADDKFEIGTNELNSLRREAEKLLVTSKFSLSHNILKQFSLPRTLKTFTT